jgi:hypothetical protein
MERGGATLKQVGDLISRMVRVQAARVDDDGRGVLARVALALIVLWMGNGVAYCPAVGPANLRG